MASTLYTNSEDLTAAALARLTTRDATLRTTPDPRAVEECRQEVEGVLTHLTVALWADEPELFLDHARWLARRARVQQPSPVRPRSSYLQHQAFGEPPPRACGPVQTLEAVAEVIEERLTNTVEARRATDLLRRAVSLMDTVSASPSGNELPPETAPAEYLHLLLQSGEAEASHMARRWAAERGLLDTYTQILMPALRDLGRRWEDGSVTVAQEHYCTRATQRLMASLAAELPISPTASPASRRALVLCPERELHCVGADAFADLLTAEGWTVRCLGANAPSSSLLSEVLSLEPHLFAISLTVADSVRGAASAITAAHAAAASRICMLVGGPLITRYPRLAAPLRADIAAHDLAGGLEAARSVIPHHQRLAG